VIDRELLNLLVCPESQTRLRLADPSLVERLNRAIAAGEVRNRVGRPVDEPLEGGLVREDGTLLYPIRDGIPSLLADEAIEIGKAEWPVASG